MIKGRAMPRKSKQQPTSVTAPGQPYGIASEQQAAMQMIPLPDTQVTGTVDAPVTPDMTASAPLEAPTTSPNSMETAIQEALISPSPDAAAFSALTSRANESIFTPASMPSAPRPSDVGNILRALAEDAGGDPVLSQLAAQADQQRL
jgi:hypothetical protein